LQAVDDLSTAFFCSLYSIVKKHKEGSTMAKLDRSITINAPVEKVFDLVSDPNNMLEIWPNLVEVKDIQRLPISTSGERRW
jgi:hypothetical protein